MRGGAPQAGFVLLLPLLLSACTSEPDRTAPAPPPGGTTGREPTFALEPFLEGLEKPVQVVDIGDGRLFIVEQHTGRVRVWKNDAYLPSPFLDVGAFITKGNEQGLLSIAFDPDFAQNGRVFVDYTDRDGDTQLVRYTRSLLDPDRADPLSSKTILSVTQPESNHNGGLVAFGPDGNLYVALGDGGSAGDPQGNGQDVDTLLGKLLRVDVRGEAYASPSDNPFVGRPGRDEIWAYGLRNPWRFTFDRERGDLWIADVGQNGWEEVNYAAASSRGGENYGWNAYEGNHVFKPGVDAPGAVFPVAEYARADGHCAITGGYVYRGAAVAPLLGVYVYGDYCSGTIWGLWPEGDAWVGRQLKVTDSTISAFAETSEGELLLVDHGGGRVLRLAAG